MKMIFIFALLECIVSLIIQFRAISSVGSEHLPYKQGVTGSNPVSPTEKAFRNFGKVFYFKSSPIYESENAMVLPTEVESI